MRDNRRGAISANVELAHLKRKIRCGASFLVQGASPAKNSALTSAGAELRLINGVEGSWEDRHAPIVVARRTPAGKSEP
jgi:hypothetical protein